jgi:sulfite reductase (NADPH) flavoprotein alpha-component
MTTLEFPGPGLSAEQWEQIQALSISLKPGQGLWISGYFAGLDQYARSLVGAVDLALPGREPPVAEASAPLQRSVTILFGSETGNSSALAKALAERLQQQGLSPTVVDMANYKPRRLAEEQDLLIITSTHGEGDPPASALGFFEFVEGRKAPRLPGLRYAVLALGDSTYEHYCEAGRRLDRRLEELGGTRAQERVECDVDYDDPAAAWIDAALKTFAKTEPAAPRNGGGSVPAAAREAKPAARFDKRNPFPAPVVDNLVLTGRGSSKETRHVELSLAGSGLSFQPGDALGVLPRNDPALVDTLLDLLSLSADTPLTVKDRATTLGEALAGTYEITAATPRFLDRWAELSGAAELQALRAETQREARAEFLRNHHVIDIVRRFPVPGVSPDALVAGLRPLQPRLYSIASSQALAPDEVHLTVSTVRYELHGEPRLGVASGHLADRLAPDATLPVYVQPSPHFRLPAGDVPILMIGAGTGIAPYRAFLQEREAQGASSPAWLIFGERNFHTDFLYQTEWQSWLEDGVLSRMHVAFSRDQADKIYVQHRLREQARDVYAWLEDGAHLYLCGDGTHLAPDVHAALAAIVEQERGCSHAAATAYLGELKSQHRYHIDVY